MSYKTGLFALSGDPIHLGHIEVVRIAKQKCDKLYVLISDNDEKAGKYLFSLGERVAMARQAFSSFEGVEVIFPKGNKVLTDIYIRYGCDVIFRGLRNDADARYEEATMKVHKTIHPMNVEFIVVNEGVFSTISSSLIKSFAHHHLDVSHLVPLFVKRKVEEKLHNLYKVGLTGQIATGKSFIGKKLTEKYRFGRNVSRRFNVIDPDVQKARQEIDPSWRTGPRCHYINMDEYIRNIYSSEEPGCIKITHSVIDICKNAGCDVTTDGVIDRFKLAPFFFSCPQEIKKQIEDVSKPMLNVMYRDDLNRIASLGTVSIVILEWAQLIEMNMSHWTNHNVIIVDSPHRNIFAEQRGMTPQILIERSKNQLSADEKIKKLQSVAQGQEKIFKVENKIDDPAFAENLSVLYGNVCNFFGV